MATPTPTPSSTVKPLAKKPSRTVHIDVYCTGSDVEDSSSIENSSSNNSNRSNSHSSDALDAPHMIDLESNSTPQTVYDSNHMKLQHVRINKAKELPRRIIATKEPNYMNSSSYGNLRDYMLSQCDSRDEVTESKQMLFEKHVGDISDGRNQMFSKPTRFSSLRNRNFHLHREQSDDCLSSNYPNSSHSTVRDLTCSSISSVIAASSSANVPDELEPSWKEIDFESNTIPSNVCQSDHSTNENRGDPRVARTSQTDDAWFEKRWRTFSTSIMHDSIKEKETVDSDICRRDYAIVLHSDEDLPSGCDIQVYQTDSNEQPKYRRFGGRGKSMELPERSIQMRNQTRTNQLWPKPEFRNDDVRSPTPMPTGYTREHLMRARKFGSVIGSIRKPGHHVGPSKNPDCSCEYCRRWFSERGDHFRERASSLDITFISCSPNQRYTRKF